MPEELTTPITPEPLPPAPVSYQDIQADPQELNARRLDFYKAAGSPRMITREYTAVNQALFWERLSEAMRAPEPEVYKWACSEYNKIILKMLPTTLANDEDNPLTATITHDERERIQRALDAIVGPAQ